MTAHPLTAHVLLLGLAALAAACAAGEDRSAASVKADLEAVAKRKVFFGHQSVGQNVIDGLQEVARREGVPLRISDGPVAGAGVAHALLAENGDPARKLESFAAAVSSGPGAGADVAFMKLCYVDITAKTDVASLFAAYRARLSELQAANPGVTFVHVTAPLQTVEGGARGWAKRLLGRTLWGTDHNARREEYNELLRREYGGKAPLFDLARVESTLPDGSAATASWNGGEVRVLAPEYTDDGGHLNERGRVRVAEALVAFLAGLPQAPATR